MVDGLRPRRLTSEEIEYRDHGRYVALNNDLRERLGAICWEGVQSRDIALSGKVIAEVAAWLRDFDGRRDWPTDIASRDERHRIVKALDPARIARPCAYGNGRHDFRHPVGEGEWRCSAPGCTALGVPPHHRPDDSRSEPS